MTVSIGALCTDGVVMCADTLISNSGFKYYESKLFTIPLANGAVLSDMPARRA